MNYNNQTDEELVEKCKQGNEFALVEIITRYRSLVLAISRRYFLAGGDDDDLAQEGTIGLYKACLSYTSDKGASFSTFARMCIKRQIQSAIKIANRKKFHMLNESLTFSALGTAPHSEESEDEELILIIPSTELGPDEKLIEEEKLIEIKKDIKQKLSDSEYQILELYLKGLKYVEIAESLGVNNKKVDNALTSIKRKLSHLKKQ